MKKILFTLCLCSFMVVSYAQKAQNDDYYKGVEYYDNLKLTIDQKQRIKRLNQEMGAQFAAIGKDRTLSGYEKGQKKRALAMKKREAIYKILTENQREVWKDYSDGDSKSSSSSDYTTYNYSLRKSISNKYDNLLDQLEDKYDADKDAIEDNPRLSKEERKSQEKALKRAYKTEKERLKREKEAAKQDL